MLITIKISGLNMTNNSIQKLFQIKYPMIQGGMVWVSGAKLAAAVANQGCLGLIGAGSMNSELLKWHILKAKELSPDGALGVNIPLLYSQAKEQIETALKLGIKIFFTSAGSPKKFTSMIQGEGGIVAHVTSSPDLAIKCESAGVDAVVAEGLEAGGHNGRDEITTMVLIPQVRNAISLPLIAAGGVACGKQMAACFCLGADAVQIGSRFAASIESSAHPNFKEAIIKAKFGDTFLGMKKSVPVRLLNNSFAQTIKSMEANGASKEELVEFLGKGRAKKGMLEGDLENGELEIGQVSGMINQAPAVREIVQKMILEYNQVFLERPLAPWSRID
jgi:enoyl-[acyl-carrier protein] reductase II